MRDCMIENARLYGIHIFFRDYTSLKI